MDHKYKPGEQGDEEAAAPIGNNTNSNNNLDSVLFSGADHYTVDDEYSTSQHYHHQHHPNVTLPAAEAGASASHNNNNNNDNIMDNHNNNNSNHNNNNNIDTPRKIPLTFIFIGHSLLLIVMTLLQILVFTWDYTNLVVGVVVSATICWIQCRLPAHVRNHKWTAFFIMFTTFLFMLMSTILFFIRWDVPV